MTNGQTIRQTIYFNSASKYWQKETGKFKGVGGEAMPNTNCH